jgi:hypothetical protein
MLQRKLIISFRLGPASDAGGRRPRAGLGGWESLQKTLGVGTPTRRHLTSLYLQTHDNFPLFSKIL